VGLRVHRELRGETLILALEGRLDAEGAEDLELALHEVALAPPSTLLIDGAELLYASAAGVEKLREGLSRLPQSASVRLCGLRAEIKTVLEAAQLRLPILPSREEALSTQRLKQELALVDAVTAILRPPPVPAAAVSDERIDQAARLLGVAAGRGPTAPAEAGSRDEPPRATWVTERPSILMRRPPAKKRHPFIRWLRRLIGERD
jgi:anti-anti-sigma regulatory factor